MTRLITCLLGLLLAFADAGAATPFATRIDGLTQQLAQQLGAGQSLDNVRIAWVFLPGDREPDALVLARPSRNDCAGNPPNRSCTGYLFKGLGNGGFQLVGEFRQRIHPLALELVDNELRALWISADSGASPNYRRYVFAGDAFAPAGDPLPVEQLQTRRVVLMDDRNMASPGDMAQAARGFANESARLAPFRLYVDTMTITEERQGNALVYDSSFDVRVRGLQEALLADAVLLSTGLTWPQTLELRLRSCVDWMVSRRFWEVEDRRLSSIGTCVEPALFAFKQGIVRSPAAMADLVRYRLLRDVGIAYLLRVASQPLALRQALRDPRAQADTLFAGTVAGLLIGQQLRVQSLEQAAVAQAAQRQLSQRWFEKFERESTHYISRTPELRAFDAELDLADAALACLRRTAAKVTSSACNERRAEQTARIQQMIKESLQP